MEDKYTKVLNKMITDEVKAGRQMRFSVATASMSPCIRPHDEIIVQESSVAKLKRGDVVVFQRNNEFYTHRFLFERTFDSKRTLFTKGDYSLNIDQPVLEEEFIGRVVGVQRGKQHIDFENKFWKIINTVVGKISLGAWTSYTFLRKIKNRLRNFIQYEYGRS